MGKIIFLESRLFRNSMIETYQINQLKESGHEIEIWYLGQLFGVSNNIVLKAPAIEEYVVMINSLSYLKAKVEDLPANSVFFSMLGLLYYYPILYKVIKSRKDLIWIGRITKSIPKGGGNNKQSIFKAVFGSIMFYRIYRPLGNVVLYLVQKVIRKWGRTVGVKSYEPDYLMVTNVKQVPQSFPQDKVIITHADDYNIHLLKKNIDVDTSLQDAIVFLDQMLYFHPDFRNLGEDKKDVEDYYYNLNKVLDDLSRTYGKPVVVAGHPEADKNPQYSEKFKGKKFVVGKSVSLVRHAALVVSHYSTAVNFAAIYDKPLLLLVSNSFKKYDKIMNPLRAFSGALQATIVNIDDYNQEALEQSLKPDYKLYKENYIKTENTPEELSYPYAVDYVLARAKGSSTSYKMAETY
ncbi:hypothetical protein D770_00770 [Flammeovirgaceae bacterium 311]|nr:hypothetical protein D770_00770 [Flammeovirgaceae bacterium 311]